MTQRARTDYANWNETFMNLAICISKRSKDPNRQVGATIVNNNKIIGMGYNGFPNNCHDTVFPWCRINNENNENKYLYVVHAELNAILNSQNIPDGSILYTTLFPCNECCKAIIQKNIKTIYYLEIKEENDITEYAAKKMLDSANVKCIKLNVNTEINNKFDEEIVLCGDSIYINILFILFILCLILNFI